MNTNQKNSQVNGIDIVSKKKVKKSKNQRNRITPQKNKQDQNNSEHFLKQTEQENFFFQ